MEGLDLKLDEIKTRKPTTTAKNLVQETTMPYEQYLVWSTDLIREKRLLYSGAQVCEKRYGYGKLKEKLEWIKKKNCITPLGAYRWLIKKT